MNRNQKLFVLAMTNGAALAFPFSAINFPYSPITLAMIAILFAAGLITLYSIIIPREEEKYTHNC